MRTGHSSGTPAGSATPGHFTPAFFTFFRQLKRNNNREWFAEHKDRYVADVEAPMLRFIADFHGRLGAISKAFIVNPRRMGGSMFRIYRDTRFSADKSPFKTWMAARFPHEITKKGQSGPGFYLHLGPGEGFGGGGLYHADQPAITRVRQAIVADPKSWKAVRETALEDDGESLKRPPAGFDPAHPFTDDLKRKNFYTGVEFTEAQVVAPDFLDQFTQACRDAAPLVRFLTKALDLRW